MADLVQLPTDILYRTLFLRALSHSSSLGADSGECLLALRRARPLSPSSWASAWSELASRLDRHASSLLELDPPQKQSAKLAYLRAANYHRTAFAPSFGHPLATELVLPSYKAMADSFAHAASLFEPPFIPINIPFQGVTLTGYLAKPSAAAPSNGRLMVIIGGYDAPKEEFYFFCAHHALIRGYAVFFFDGPGQGGALLESALKLSHNYDEVLALGLEEVSKHGIWAKTVVMGLSLGGLLCLRAVASPKVQPRLHAVIADPGELNLLDAFRARLPFPQNICDQLPDGPAWAIPVLNFILNRLVAAQGMAGWALRRGMLVHGYDTPLAYVRSLNVFDNTAFLDKITIPTLVTMAEMDEVSAQAKLVYEKLVECHEKKLIIFRDEEGAGDHCEMGERMYFSEQVFAWLESVLGDGT